MPTTLIAIMLAPVCGDGLPPQWITLPSIQLMISPVGVFITMSVYDPDGMESLLGWADGPSHWTENIYPSLEGATVLGYAAFDEAIPGDYTFYAIATDLCGDTTELWFPFTVPDGVGDMNCDGTVDSGDTQPFVTYLSDFAAWQGQYPNCPPEIGDINGDGTYGQASIGDINPFVALLTG